MDAEGARAARIVLLIAGWAVASLVGSESVMAQARSLAEPDQVEAPNDRLHVQTQGDVRVTTSVPSRDETADTFGTNLYARNIQPVWVRVENIGDTTLLFLPTGLDEAYFTPIETAYRRSRRPLFDVQASRDFYDSGMALQIDPGNSRSGYVFTRLDEGTKSFNVDVIGTGEQARMSFFVPVPGLKLDHYTVEWESLYAPDEIEDLDLPGLISYLESLPCCVTDKKGKNNGDPLNFALIGELRDAYYSFMRAGWDETETIYGSSLWKTAKSALSGNEYRYSPISALYVFGRAQDVALQKARSSIHERNHLRLWLTPRRFEGKPVWIGQISRDIGVRLTWKTITTHKIDPDVDDAREFLLEDLAYAQSLSGFGYVGGVGRAPIDAPRGNLTGDPYFTDGLRMVLFVSAETVDIDEIEILDLGSHAVDFLE
ncbi:MAG: LssY C-terminal domain-containing protein [Gammaproteobacteria bacterium]